MKSFLQLVINPGSTSTKLAVFEDHRPLFHQTLRHQSKELESFNGITEQFEYRRNLVIEAVKMAGINPGQLDAVVGRGGLLKPVPGGTYIVNEEMMADLKQEARGSHASNLGGLIAYSIAREFLIPAFVVDPVCIDEMQPLARISGIPEIPRESIFHALNQKAIGRRAAGEMNQEYEKVSLIVVHLGGGISVGAHDKGKVIDVNNAIPGEGPFSPERSGGVPIGRLVEMCFSGKYSHQEILRKIMGKGGLVAYLGTNDAVEVERRIETGDEEARLIYEAMAYQIAKEIGSCSTVLKGKVDAIILTGGLAHSKRLTGWIEERVRFIAPVKVYEGEDEMEALAAGGLRVLRGQEQAKSYS